VDGDGVLDNAFAPHVDNWVNVIVAQPDGRLVLGGQFTSIDGVPLGYMARLDGAGQLDLSYLPQANDAVETLALQADGKLLLGGRFTTVGGASHQHVARLLPDGQLDTAFGVDADSNVHALALLDDGKLALGGTFATVGGLPRAFLARVSQPQAALQSLQCGAGAVTWSRSGAAPEFALPPQLSLLGGNGNPDLALGRMSRVAGGWRYSFSPPIGQAFTLRASGVVPSGQFNGSQGRVESVRQCFISDGIFADGFD
jgi:hypothetical protein